MTRQRIPAGVRRELIAYYGTKRCVATGATDNVDWHHLDDNPASSVFENLVPLARDANLLLAQYRRTTLGGLPSAYDPRLSPDALTIQAEAALLQGRPSLAVGAARLGLSVSRLYLQLPPTLHLAYAASALHYVRHAFDERILATVLKDDVLRVVLAEGAPSVETRVALRLELGALMQDVDRPLDAIGILDQALDSATRSGARSSATFEALWRRSQLLNSIGNRRGAAYDFDRAEELAGRSMRQQIHLRRTAIASSLQQGQSGDIIDELDEITGLLIRDDGQPRPFASTYWATASALLDVAAAGLLSASSPRLEIVHRNIEDAARILRLSLGGVPSRRLSAILNSGMEIPESIVEAIKTVPVKERRLSDAGLALVYEVMRALE